MRLLLPLTMVWMLLRPALVMDAASDACRLFVFSVLPGLMPYMVLALMLVSRMSGRLPPFGLTLLGWCGGSPTGARLLRLYPVEDRRTAVRVAVSAATMSPMFLLGTVGGWLGSRRAGIVLLGSVLTGGWLTGQAAGHLTPARKASSAEAAAPAAPLPFGEAVEQAARTMLLVCGTMMMLRVLAALAASFFPNLALPLTTLLEVTTGAAAIAALPLPLALRTAILAAATGFGGLASVLQNRAVYPPDTLSLPEQLIWQALHGSLSFLLALGVMLLTA